MSLIVLGILTLCSSVTHGYDYCTAECDTPHTMCMYPKEEPGPFCKGYEAHLMTAEDKKLILDKHNELRRSVTNGEVPNHPKALDMVDLQWNDEDEMIARRWALQCEYRPTLKHDKCRKLADGTYAGQNLFLSSHAHFEGKMLTNGTQWFFNEHRFYVPEGKNLFPPKHKKGMENEMTGHYTQLVWSRTTHVGCERTYSDQNEFLVCNYSPGGNVKGEPIYEPGEVVTFSGASARRGVGVFVLSVSLVLALKSKLFTGSL